MRSYCLNSNLVLNLCADVDLQLVCYIITLVANFSSIKFY